MTETSMETFQKQAESHPLVPYVRTFFTDLLTPIELFKQVEDQAVFILESKDPASSWSRYSFIGLNPSYRIQEKYGLFQFVEETSRQVKAENASLAVLFEESLSIINPGIPSVSLPFKGGAVGVVAYDTIEQFEDGMETIEKSEDDSNVLLLFCETIIALDHDTKELSFVHYENNDKENPEVRYEKARKKVESLMAILQDNKKTDTFLSPYNANQDVDFSNVVSNYKKEKFLEDVRKIKEYIKAGDIFQAVLSQRFERDIHVTGFQLYRILRMVNPSPYLFYLKLDGREVIGSSPERLIQVDNKHVEIHPIAGTRKRGKSEEEDLALEKDLLADEKERAEHYMLVDLARNDVGRVAEYGSVKTPVLLEVGRFSHVMHIISKVTGRLADGTLPIDALQASFPAGTVSGAPKIRAMQILKELEPTRRGIYAGAVCYLGYDGNIDSCISIRTMVVEGGKARIQAGAGIVADSVPELEYEETQNKAAALLRAIEVAEDMFHEKGEAVKDA